MKTSKFFLLRTKIADVTKRQQTFKQIFVTPALCIRVECVRLNPSTLQSRATAFLSEKHGDSRVENGSRLFSLAILVCR